MHGLAVLPADVQDRDAAKLLLAPLAGALPRPERLWADGGDAGQLVGWVRERCGWELVIVEKPKDRRGFEVLPKRWVVERTFAWLGKCRRLGGQGRRALRRLLRGPRPPGHGRPHAPPPAARALTSHTLSQVF